MLIFIFPPSGCIFQQFLFFFESDAVCVYKLQSSEKTLNTHLEPFRPVGVAPAHTARGKKFPAFSFISIKERTPCSCLFQRNFIKDFLFGQKSCRILFEDAAFRLTVLLFDGWLFLLLDAYSYKIWYRYQSKDIHKSTAESLCTDHTVGIYNIVLIILFCLFLARLLWIITSFISFNR